jgi:hypothetical protein
MAKKPLNVSIRKASSAPPSEKEAFVARAGFRGLTIYVPDALADRLSAFCKESGKDQSELVSELLAKHFEALDNPAKAPVEQESALAMLMKWIESKIPKMLRPAWL